MPSVVPIQTADVEETAADDEWNINNTNYAYIDFENIET